MTDPHKTHSIGYFSKDQCETIEDAATFRKGYRFTQNWLDDDLRELSNEAAKHMWEKKDGWEWMRDRAELTLVKDGEEELGDFDVTIDFDPVFYSSRKQNGND